MTIINRWSDHIDSPENNPIYIGNPSDEVWTTKEGQIIRVGDMTDTHVRNCYNMVMGTRSEYWQNVFRMEMEKRQNMKQETYMVSITCSWIEPVKANSMKEAIKKAEQKYKYGRGRFPREYVDVEDGKCDYYFAQVED